MIARPCGRGAGGALAVALMTVMPAACAEPPPVTVNPAFVDRYPSAEVSKTPVQACTIRVVEVVDARRAPEVLGMVSGRVVKSPADSTAWLKSILGGLDSRGFALTFDKNPGPTLENPVVVRVSLHSAWVTSVATNKTANVVLRVRAERAGKTAIDRDYRGGVTRMNWASTVGELQGLVDSAFTAALNDMAKDIHPLCEP